MPNYNKFIGIGRITRDIELKYTPKGTAVGKFGLAINRSWSDDSGQKREETTFLDIDCFGKQAENVQKFFRKGSHIMVDGHLKTDSWEDKTTGQKRSKTGVVLDSFQFIDQKQDGSSAQPHPTARPARPNPPQAAYQQGEPDSDIPF